MTPSQLYPTTAIERTVWTAVIANVTRYGTQRRIMNENYKCSVFSQVIVYPRIYYNTLSMNILRYSIHGYTTIQYPRIYYNTLSTDILQYSIHRYTTILYPRIYYNNIYKDILQYSIHGYTTILYPRIYYNTLSTDILQYSIPGYTTIFYPRIYYYTATQYMPGITLLLLTQFHLIHLNLDVKKCEQNLLIHTTSSNCVILRLTFGLTLRLLRI